MRAACRQVRRNAEAAGIDGVSVEEPGPHLRGEWQRIEEALPGEQYEPQPVKRFWRDIVPLAMSRHPPPRRRSGARLGNGLCWRFLPHAVANDIRIIGSSDVVTDDLSD